jgi:hypothetical protein
MNLKTINMVTEIKLSKKDQALIDSLLIGTQNETVTNPFSGKSVELTPQGVALYDFIKGSEALNLGEKLAQGLYIFRKLYPNEYMDLLD